jgi:predicted amidohydrolase YtcJ
MSADLIMLPERVRTLDPERPLARAVAIAAGRLLAVGERDEVLALRGPATEVVAFPGACLLPGFHDAHVHLGQHGLERSAVALHDVDELEGALARVAERAQATPMGAWITGAGFSIDRWGLADRPGSPLRAADLDAVAPHHPVLLQSQDHHAGWVNSLALRAAGIDEDTIDPQHGSIVRELGGAPSGYLLEHAVDLVAGEVPLPNARDLAAAVWAAGADLAARGITTVHHMAYEPPAAWRAIADAASRDDYPLRVWACLPHADVEHAAAIGLAGGQGGERFTVGGAKFFADGALGSRTAWMLEPYLDTGQRGLQVESFEVLLERFRLVAEAGFAPVTHAIGDAALRVVVDALEATADVWRPAGLLPRIEHVQHAHPDDVARVGRLGVVASMQPIHLRFDAASIVTSLFDRRARAFPMRSLAAAGAILAFGSDTPVAPPDVPEGLRAAVRRRGSDGTELPSGEALGVEEALRGFTHGAARAIGRGLRSGLVRRGFDADLVVVAHDPVDSLDELRVVATVSAGRFTHRALA